MKTFVVLGMHRSATSLVAKALNHEISMGSRRLRRHFEDIRFVTLNDSILKAAGGTWDQPPSEEAILAQQEEFTKRIETLVREASVGRELWGWKDPRTTLTIKLYLPHLENPHFVACFRDPYEVALSLHRRDDRISMERGVTLANIYNERLLRFLDERQLPKAPGVQSRRHRRFVGPRRNYDLIGAMQFNLLTHIGLRESHTLLDIGCGSLRSGRLFLAYLLPERYYGIEPNSWLIQDGIRYEAGRDLIRLKRPRFSHDANFTLTQFGRTFDFILAHSIFTHAAPTLIQRCLTEAADVMSDTSLMATTFIKGATDYDGNKAWVYPGCVRYRRQTLEKLTADAGLACETIDWPHPHGQTWLLLRKPA